MKKWFIWALLALMISGVQAADKKKGEGKEKGKGSGIAAMDTNKDGKVSKEEFLSAQEKRAEKDGQDFDAEKAEEMFTKRDKNGDGVLTADEMGGKPKEKAAPKKKQKPANDDDSDNGDE